MKKYRTSEAIAMLENNPEAKLTAKIAGQTCEIRVDNEGYIMTHFSGTFEGFEGNIGINTEWELIQQPITIQEAARLFDEEKKTIRCEFPHYMNKTEVCKDTFKPNDGCMGANGQDNLLYDK